MLNTPKPYVDVVLRANVECDRTRSRRLCDRYQNVCLHMRINSMSRRSRHMRDLDL